MFVSSCFLCDGDTTENDFCFGCKQPICSDCSKNESTGGFGHDPEDHLEEDEEEDEDEC